MSALIIHPKDPTTDFLKTIYAPISNKTIIEDGISKTELNRLIENHDRVIILGHGTPRGLLSVGPFYDAGLYIIEDSFSELLSKKKDNIYIWCHANQFVLKNQLSGFYSGMFISEVEEGFIYDFWDLEPNTIEESNLGFASIVSRYINEPLDILYKNVIHEYGILAQKNPVAQFNFKRLFLNEISEGSSTVTTKQFS
jgi:hypothetical protein